MKTTEKIECLKTYKKIALYAMFFLFFLRFIFEMLEFNLLAEFAYLFAPIAGLFVILFHRKIKNEVIR